MKTELQKQKEAIFVLSELIILKGYKDQHGKDEYYLSEQPKLWEKANKVILEIDVSSLQSHPTPEISEEKIVTGIVAMGKFDSPLPEPKQVLSKETKPIKEWLEKKIQGCDELGGMEKEKWAFQQCLKELNKG